MTGVLIERGEDTETRREGGGVTMKGCDDKPRSAKDCWEPPAAQGETWNRFSEPPTNSLISDFWPPELGENTFLLF